MLDLEAFVADCRSALRQPDRAGALRPVLAGATASPAAVVAAVGEPGQGQLTVIHRAPDLTVLNVVWPPYMRLAPHDHLMLAGIAVYGGREENRFFRRTPHGSIEPSGGRSIDEGHVLLMGDETIHSVHNPVRRYTGAIHVYAGDFFDRVRTVWDDATGEVMPNPPEVVEVFAEAERAWRRQEETGPSTRSV